MRRLTFALSGARLHRASALERGVRCRFSAAALSRPSASRSALSTATLLFLEVAVRKAHSLFLVRFHAEPGCGNAARFWRY